MRPLESADRPDALRLVRARPLPNVFLEFVVRSRVLGATPGILGYFHGHTLSGMMVIGPLGGTVLEVREEAGFAPLAEAASRSACPPRHIMGLEEVTVPFWKAYAPYAPQPLWERREPFYVLDRSELRDVGGALSVAPATEGDLDAVVENSALQHVEDLGDDRFALDPEGFRERHRIEIRQRRWWVVRESGRIVFQAHVGVENEESVQVGGVVTRPEARNRRVATRALGSLCERLLERRPAVSLFCDEANLPARRVYDRLGFRALFQFRSWLLPPGGWPAHRG